MTTLSTALTVHIRGRISVSRETVRRLVVTALFAVVCALSLATAATAATTDFSSSFESSDPRPAWTNTSDGSAGVIGPKREGIPGNVTDSVIAMRARGENPPNEVKENLVDGSSDSKWLDFSPTSWVELELAQPVKVVRYALT